jgi:cytochrome d ubiquinol oxidase subunit I
MLFGWNRVSNRVHTFATVLVAVGTTISAFWILVLNSWMQTPAGFEMRDGVAHATDWWAIVFNPSMPYRLTHMLLASGLTAAFLVAGVSAFRWLRRDRSPGVMAGLRTGVFLAAALIPVQIFVGDMHGLNTLEHQPAKIAAMEGIWETRKGAPMVVFGLPDEATKSNRFEIAIPNIASFYLTHDWNGEVKGLNSFEHRPPVAPVFFAFRTMVGIGLLMLATSWLAAWQLRRSGEVHHHVARVLVAMTFAGWIATLSGWYVTEIGRQPWLVTGILTAKQAASSVAAPMIASTLIGYLLVYAGLLAAYIATIFYLARKSAAPADHSPAEPVRAGGATAAGKAVAAAL